MLLCLFDLGIAQRTILHAAAPYPVRPARPRPYLDFEKEKVAAAAVARRHYRGLTWLGGAPVSNLKKPTCASKRDALELANLQ